MNESACQDHASDVMPLTPREMECLRLKSQGLTAPQIGRRLCISHRTVNYHCGNAYAKLGVHNCIQALNVLRDLNTLREIEARQTAESQT